MKGCREKNFGTGMILLKLRRRDAVETQVGFNFNTIVKSCFFAYRDTVGEKIVFVRDSHFQLRFLLKEKN